MKVQAYLAFRGECQEALNYYADLFDAQIVNRQTYENSKRDIPEDYRHNLEHAELKGKGIHLMAYDASPDTPLNNGNNIHLSVDLEDEQKALKIFNKLSEGGIIHEEFREHEWNALYGRCTDKYKVDWMVNCKL
ncbi:VOC family protein [Tenacibaculum sp. IB213877]|uniref:VOC family protein n=1 Tax=Tenacibaculum sp. IB213877 TaxID=3097351 RepID=UPI002A5A0B89|nr:VOC family protein [Tenacibaculum sp. IB213877]MDY0779342.1 VOC family protein [Tenacibaculum sp. IB213877]